MFFWKQPPAGDPDTAGIWKTRRATMVDAHA